MYEYGDLQKVIGDYLSNKGSEIKIGDVKDHHIDVIKSISLLLAVDMDTLSQIIDSDIEGLSKKGVELAYFQALSMFKKEEK